MAIYKVPQNVEAEDKLLGPLSFKQFIFAIVAFLCGGAAFISFRLQGIAPVNYVIGALFIFPTLVFLILAFYQRPDQSVESYLVALLNYLFKPRIRRWNRDGIIDHVVINAPKKAETHYSDERTRSEVKSQLGELAKLIDTRGWSSKHVESAEDDRLVSFDELNYAATANNPNKIEDSDSIDILDQSQNPLVDDFESKTQAAAASARERAIQNMHAAREPATPPQQPQTS